jgi:hypothetical protein
MGHGEPGAGEGDVAGGLVGNPGVVDAGRAARENEGPRANGRRHHLPCVAADRRVGRGGGWLDRNVRVDWRSFSSESTRILADEPRKLPPIRLSELR